MSELIDPTAQVHPSARLGPGVVVGAHAVVGPGCVLHPYAIVGPHTTLGPGCAVHPFAVVGGPAQDRRTDPEAPFTLVCGAENTFREGVTISRGTGHGGGATRIGDGNLLMAHVHIGHDCVLGDHNTLSNNVSLAGHVTLADRVTIGGHAAVHQFSRVGTLAFVAANAMVSQDVPPYCMAAGDRARLCGLNITGLRRAGLPADTRLALKQAYRALTGKAQALPRDFAEAGPEVRRFADFFAGSDRGITPVARAS